MFEAICFRSSNDPTGKKMIDLGFLAEAMLFYSDIHVLTGRAMLAQMVSGIGPEIIIDLVDRGYLKVQYEYEMSGVHTSGQGSIGERHSGVIFHSPNHTLQDTAPKVFEEVIGKAGRGRRLATRFMNKVGVYKPNTDLIKAFEEDILDHRFTRLSAAKLLELWTPGYLPDGTLEFDVSKDTNGFSVSTNIRFDIANSIYHKFVSPSHSSLTAAYFLAHILKMRENISLGSSLSADIAGDEVSSKLIATKMSEILAVQNRNSSEISNFQEFVFENGRAVREVMNSGERSYQDLLKLLEKAEKFKKWIKDKPSDANLVKDYFREVTESSWVDKLPAKSVRWSMFTGAGLGMDLMGLGGLGTAAGIALGAADTFILDKLIKGWKPNQFIDDSMAKFLKK